jgi:hypothetical protein
MRISVLELGILHMDRDSTSRILLALVKPTVDQLILQSCESQYFHAAWIVGMVSWTDLSVHFSSDRPDTDAKVEALACMIRGAFQLNHCPTCTSK